MDASNEAGDKPAENSTTADGEKLFGITLPRAAVGLLRALLTIPGWTASPKVARRGAKLLRKLPKVPAAAPHGVEVEAWESEPLSFSISESERKAGCRCIEEQLKAKRFGVAEYTEDLFTAFGVTDGGED